MTRMPFVCVGTIRRLEGPTEAGMGFGLEPDRCFRGPSIRMDRLEMKRLSGGKDARHLE